MSTGLLETYRGFK